MSYLSDLCIMVDLRWHIVLTLYILHNIDTLREALKFTAQNKTQKYVDSIHYSDVDW
jgi:hypothetical protein